MGVQTSEQANHAYSGSKAHNELHNPVYAFPNRDSS